MSAADTWSGQQSADLKPLSWLEMKWIEGLEQSNLKVLNVYGNFYN